MLCNYLISTESSFWFSFCFINGRPAACWFVYGICKWCIFPVYGCYLNCINLFAVCTQLRTSSLLADIPSMKMFRCATLTINVAGSRCVVAGWLAAPRCAAAAWQLQDVVRQHGGSALIVRAAARVVSITLYPPIPGSSCLYLQVIKLWLFQLSVLGTDPARRLVPRCLQWLAFWYTHGIKSEHISWDSFTHVLWWLGSAICICLIFVGQIGLWLVSYNYVMDLWNFWIWLVMMF
jgi:hypothetical protein